MKLMANIHWSILMTYLDFGGQRSTFKVTEGRRCGEGIDVDAYSFCCISCYIPVR